jgi:hypothetical protein
MLQAHPVSTDDISQFLNELFEFDEHAKRVRSLANATLGVMTSASLAVHAIGQGLAHARGLTPKHAVKQVDRLLSNQGIDVDRYFEHWVPYIVGERKSILVALDWTAFDGDGQETLALSLLTGQGRSMPMLWKTARKEDLKREKGSGRSVLSWRMHCCAGSTT